GDAHDLRAELLEHVGDEIVCHRPRRRRTLQLHENRRRLGMADPDRQELVALRGLQQDDRLLADEVKADTVDVHLLHGRLFVMLAQPSALKPHASEGSSSRATGTRMSSPFSGSSSSARRSDTPMGSNPRSTYRLPL